MLSDVIICQNETNPQELIEQIGRQKTKNGKAALVICPKADDYLYEKLVKVLSELKTNTSLCDVDVIIDPISSNVLQNDQTHYSLSDAVFAVTPAVHACGDLRIKPELLISEEINTICINDMTPLIGQKRETPEKVIQKHYDVARSTYCMQ